MFFGSAWNAAHEAFRGSINAVIVDIASDQSAPETLVAITKKTPFRVRRFENTRRAQLLGITGTGNHGSIADETPLFVRLEYIDVIAPKHLEADFRGSRRWRFGARNCFFQGFEWWRQCPRKHEVDAVGAPQNAGIQFVIMPIEPECQCADANRIEMMQSRHLGTSADRVISYFALGREDKGDGRCVIPIGIFA